MDMKRIQIRLARKETGSTKVETIESVTCGETIDLNTTERKEKPKAYVIATRHQDQSVCDLNLFQQEEAIQCPRCNTLNTRLVSRFGSTPCKSMYSCNECLEPFDYFKCH